MSYNIIRSWKIKIQTGTLGRAKRKRARPARVIRLTVSMQEISGFAIFKKMWGLQSRYAVFFASWRCGRGDCQDLVYIWVFLHHHHVCFHPGWMSSQRWLWSTLSSWENTTGLETTNWTKPKHVKFFQIKLHWWESPKDCWSWTKAKHIKFFFPTKLHWWESPQDCGSAVSPSQRLERGEALSSEFSPNMVPSVKTKLKGKNSIKWVFNWKLN